MSRKSKTMLNRASSLRQSVVWRTVSLDDSKPTPLDEKVKEDARRAHEEAFRGSLWRQYLIMVLVNTVTFLQGASLPMATITNAQLPEKLDPELEQDQSWPQTIAAVPGQKNTIGMMWLYGHLVAGLVYNPVPELIGRQRGLLLDAAIFVAGFVLFATAADVWQLYLAQFLLGFPLVNTVYLCELVHSDLRGVAAAFFALAHSLGYSTTLGLGAALPTWRLAAAFGACVAGLGLGVVFLLPESPVWLLRRGRTGEAQVSLKRIRGPNYDVDLEVRELELAIAVNNATEKVTLRELAKMLWHKKFRLPFLFLSVMYLFIGWSGFFYIATTGVKLFQSYTVGSLNGFLLSFLVSLIRIPGALFAAVFIRRFPRRPVYLMAGTLTLTGHLLIAFVGLEWVPNWVSALAVACSQFGYTAGYNSVPGLLSGELLPANLRSIGTGLIATIEGLSSLTQTHLAPVIVNSSSIGQAGLFLTFTAVVAAALVYAFLIMPETSCLTLEEIENIWQSPRKTGCTLRRMPSETVRETRKSLHRMLSVRQSKMELRRRRADGELGTKGAYTSRQL